MNDERLRKAVEQQVKRMRRADRERSSLLAQSVYLGTLTLLFILPVIIGAYLGNWLDGMAQGYSMRWTLGLILAGLIIGVVNVYMFIRERN
ncbi:MAG TPA: AtpZ/AtpI family protein [Gallionella sp.]|nr:AtpZ/AtpI family protein [Gallionella sp.]